MKYDYKSIIEEIKKEDKNFLKSESIENDTFFIEEVDDVSRGKGIVVISWYWSRDLYKLALGFKEYSIRQFIVELFPGTAEEFPEQVKKSLDYTLTELIKQLSEVSPKECAPILEDLQAFIDKYETVLTSDTFGLNDLVNLIREWNQVSRSLVTISLSEVWDDYNKVIDHLANVSDIYIEEVEKEDGTTTVDLEDLKEKLSNC